MDGATTNIYDIPAIVSPVGAARSWGFPFEYEIPARVVDRAKSDTSNSYSDVGESSAKDEHLTRLRELPSNPTLWPEDADGPSQHSIELAAIALAWFNRLRFAPSRVIASAEGGVGVCFVQGDKYADIEFLNTGEILGVTSNRHDRPTVWKVEQDVHSLAKAAIRIRQFFETSSAGKDVSRRQGP